MNIDLQILLDKMLEESLEKKGIVAIQPGEFCDLLINADSFEIYGVKLNRKVMLKDRTLGCTYPGYTHLLKYSGRTFSCSTSVEISDE
ncbi:MAG: hypothetical protein KKF50_02735 [Nanoarchaeota archaeon]|nr:hypothetical protein [Nanoarchaeota archaeon]